MLVSIAVPSEHILVTASVQDVSGWLRDDIGQAEAALQPLWTISMFGSLESSVRGEVSKMVLVSGVVTVFANEERRLLAHSLLPSGIDVPPWPSKVDYSRDVRTLCVSEVEERVPKGDVTVWRWAQGGRSAQMVATHTACSSASSACLATAR